MRPKQGDADKINMIKPVAISNQKSDRAKTAPIDTFFNIDEIDNEGDNSEYISSYNYYIYYHSLKPKDPRLPKPLYKPMPDIEFIKKGVKVENEILENNEDDRSNKGSSIGKDSINNMQRIQEDFSEESGIDNMMSSLNLGDRQLRSMVPNESPSYYFDYLQSNQTNLKSPQFNQNFSKNFMNSNFKEPNYNTGRDNFNFNNQISGLGKKEDFYGFNSTNQQNFSDFQKINPPRSNYYNYDSSPLNPYQNNRKNHTNQDNSMNQNFYLNSGINSNSNYQENIDGYRNFQYLEFNKNQMEMMNLNNQNYNINNFYQNTFPNPIKNQENFTNPYQMKNPYENNYRDHFKGFPMQQENSFFNPYNNTNQLYEQQSQYGFNRGNNNKVNQGMNPYNNQAIPNYGNITHMKNPSYHQMNTGNNIGINNRNNKRNNLQNQNFMQNQGNNTVSQFNNLGNYNNQQHNSIGIGNKKGNTIDVPAFEEILENIINFSRDHSGSRLVQRKYEEAYEDDKQRMFQKLYPEVYNLTKDVFGNYVVQKLLEFSQATDRKLIFQELEGKVSELTTHMYGCRVIQKAIEYADVEDVRKYLAELKKIIKNCIEDQNGNHVIQKLIEKLPQGEHGDIIKIISGKTYELSTHQYGCRVIQRIFEYCGDNDKEILLSEIYKRINDLCFDQFGNYVVQHIIEKLKPNKITRIYDSIKGRIYEMSIHKFASNVIEKCLAYGHPMQKNDIISEIILRDDETNDSLLAMVKDKFGNYVVQKMIEVADNNVKEIIIKRIISSQSLKKRDGFSKHVINFIEKMGFSANSLK